MPLPKSVRKSLQEASLGGSVRPVPSSSSAAPVSHDKKLAASLRHNEELKRFLAVVEQRPEDFELLISNLRTEMLRAQPQTSSGKPEVPLAKQVILLGTPKQCGHHVVVSL
ncbi:unnamed protein product [Effrenium voratum]|uniref:Uncharacterized protein n=1 Tax=Effrenium voratum TaxID=2562239 RepID=A0AA36J822_9DINO|nr:unnamed protein product [Effrenium voratum]CAJ1445506.1 unnamed protein product [Effrenium voratum]